MKLKYLFTLLIAASFLGCSAPIKNPNTLYIRLNQVGFLPSDLKSAVIISKGPIFKKEFKVYTIPENSKVFVGEIQDSSKKWGNFNHAYTIDFSQLKKDGTYQIEVDGQRSYQFSIAKNIYNEAEQLLLKFFRYQRCGPTNPLLHKPCHLSDATSMVGYKSTKPIDMTGGWHDAGDYIKFFSTTAYTTYMLLFSYNFDPVKYGFDSDGNNVPDVLEEARVGIDWLMRSYFTKDNFVNQVQDTRDHAFNWRLPENDSLQYDRPGYASIGKNQLGMFCAVMSLASKIWAEKFYDYDFSKKLLAAAVQIYNLKEKVPDLDKNISGVYQDSKFYGKLSLGAVELYNVTKDNKYLNDAKTYADSAGSDFWWSYGNINSLADYRLAQIDKKYLQYLHDNLVSFNTTKQQNLFAEPLPYSWGATNSFMGVTAQAILYKSLTGSNEFDSLMYFNKDYIFGRNAWGISFVNGIGKKYSANLHSQIAFFNKGSLPGALSAGPCTNDILKNFNIKRSNFSYDYFNSGEVKYYDDRNDYITNEPTIIGNATAFFCIGYFSNR